MHIITFYEIEESLFNGEAKVEYFHAGTSEKADIVILDINSIFEFEENKSTICKEKYVSIAVIDDDSDYDAFKNFGIDAWILASEVSQINSLVNLVSKRFLQ